VVEFASRVIELAGYKAKKAFLCSIRTSHRFLLCWFNCDILHGLRNDLDIKFWHYITCYCR